MRKSYSDRVFKASDFCVFNIGDVSPTELWCSSGEKGAKGGMMQHLQPLLPGVIRQVALALLGKARLMHLKGVLEVPGNPLVKAAISRVV